MTTGQACLERYWHDRFMKQRVHCEWFRPEIADWFRANGAPGCVRCVEFGDAVRWKREGIRLNPRS